MKWFDRKFDFPTDPHLFPGFLDRIQATPKRLTQLLGVLSPNLLTTRHKDSWSIQENAGHLLNLETIWLARAKDFEKKTETLSVADLTNSGTANADFNSQPLPDIIDQFRTERSRLVIQFNSLNQDALKHSAKHPRLGTPMTATDHAFFVAEHDDHHLDRIKELITIIQ